VYAREARAVSCKCEHMQHEHPPQRATPRKVEWRTHKTPEVASPTNTVGEMTLATAASVMDAAAAEPQQQQQRHSTPSVARCSSNTTPAHHTDFAR